MCLLLLHIFLLQYLSWGKIMIFFFLSWSDITLPLSCALSVNMIKIVVFYRHSEKLWECTQAFSSRELDSLHCTFLTSAQFCKSKRCIKDALVAVLSGSETLIKCSSWHFYQLIFVLVFTNMHRSFFRKQRQRLPAECSYFPGKLLFSGYIKVHDKLKIN